MNFEDVQTLWRTQDTRPAFSLDEYVLRYIVEQRRKELSRFFFWEVVQVYGALLLTLLVSSMFPAAMYFRADLRTVGDFALAIGSVVPIVVWAISLHVAYVRRQRLEPSFTSSLREAIERDLQRIDYEISRRMSVNYALIASGLPALGAVLIVVASLRLNGNLASQGPWFAPFCVLMVAGCFSLSAWFNKRTLERKFYPRRRELQELREKLN